MDIPVSEYFVNGFEKLMLCRTGGIQFLYIIWKYSEEVLVQFKAYFITFSSTAELWTAIALHFNT